MNKLRAFVLISLAVTGLFAKASTTNSLKGFEDKIQTYQQKDFTVSPSNTKKDVFKKIRELYPLLEKATKAAVTSKDIPSTRFFDSILQVISYTYEVDNSYVLHDHVIALIKKYPNEVRKSIDGLPIEKRKILQKNLKDQEAVKKKGAG